MEVELTSQYHELLTNAYRYRLVHTYIYLVFLAVQRGDSASMRQSWRCYRVASERNVVTFKLEWRRLCVYKRKEERERMREGRFCARFSRWIHIQSGETSSGSRRSRREETRENESSSVPWDTKKKRE